MEYYIDYNLVYRNNPSWMPMNDEKARAVSLEKAYKKAQENKVTRPVEAVSPEHKATKVAIEEKTQTPAKPKKKVTYLADDGVVYDVEGSHIRNEVRENATYGKDGKRATI